MNSLITKKIEEQKPCLKEVYHITRIGIFGSYARGEETSDSDIDILVEFEETPALFELFHVEKYLEELLHKKIDLVRKQGIKHRIKEKVLQEVLYI